MGIEYTHECKGTQEEHDKNHLCKIVADRKMWRVKELIKDSIFFCVNCGRAAHTGENLCNPSEI